MPGPVRCSDSLQTQRIRAAPRIRQVFEQIETLAITYLSGGLKIQGCVMQLKSRASIPASFSAAAATNSSAS